tara:strand:+ start:54369 stop:54839 length:471 start_codon:yes stop_codon:yes gene_type:complete
MKKLITLIIASSLILITGCVTTPDGERSVNHPQAQSVLQDATLIATTAALDRVYDDNPEKTEKAILIAKNISSNLKDLINQRDLSTQSILAVLDASGINQSEHMVTQITVQIVVNRYNTAYEEYSLGDNFGLAKGYVLSIIEGIDQGLIIFENANN